MNEEFDELWREVLRQEGAAREAIDSASPGDDLPTSLAREWWNCVFQVLAVYNSRDNWPDGDDHAPVKILPVELTVRFSELAQDLSLGIDPNAIRAVRAPGRLPSSRDENLMKMVAVAYINASRSRELMDRAPVKTICREYCVSEEAVRRWQKEFSQIDPAVFTREHSILAAMRSSAAEFRLVSRSAAALKARNSKRGD